MEIKMDKIKEYIDEQIGEIVINVNNIRKETAREILCIIKREHDIAKIENIINKEFGL